MSVFQTIHLHNLLFFPFLVGRDTTAATLSWFVYLLSLHPEVADKICEELHLIVEDKTSPEAPSLNEEIMQFALLLSYDVVAKLPYLHAAITETIRLYPAVPQVLKTGLVFYIQVRFGYLYYILNPLAMVFHRNEQTINMSRKRSS